MNIADDFRTIVDNLASVTLVRAAGTQVVVPGARRISARTTDWDQTGGGVIRRDTVWDLPWPDSESPPEIGDQIDAADAESGVVFAIEQRQPGRRFRCAARTLEIHPQRGERVQIQQAVWEDLGSGPEITGWTTLLADVLVCVQPAAIEVDREGDSPTSTRRYRLFLDINLALDHNHRIQDADGTRYQVERFTNAERIDTLPTVEMTVVSTS